MLFYYTTIFIVSLVLAFLYICKWNVRYSVYFTMLFTLVPIACFGYLSQYIATSFESALIGLKITYLGGCFCTVFLTLSILELCKFPMTKIFRTVLISVNFILYVCVLTINFCTIFYKDIFAELVTMGSRETIVLHKTYGTAHLFFYVAVIFDFALSFVAILRGLKNRYKVSKKTTLILFFMMSVNIIAFFFGRAFFKNIELVPASYIITLITMLLLSRRITFYNIDDTLVDVSVKRGDIAIISLDEKRKFLGCNKLAKDLFPDLVKLKIDSHLLSDSAICKKLNSCADAFQASQQKVEEIYFYQEKYLKIICDMIKNTNARAYNFVITDETITQKYLLSLQEDISEKTKNLSEIKEIFGKNVSPEIRDYLLKKKNTLGGEKLYATIMFCDIRGFTTLSENMDVEKIVYLLNKYFNGLENCITRHNGIINKYMGDAVMAIFGAPVPNQSHEMDAYLATKDMRKTLSEMNKEFESEGLPKLRFGIGLHSGSVISGNIGTENRMEYTVIGDAVNTASRIENLCKDFSCDLLISKTTAEVLQAKSENEIQLKFVAESNIRGKERKIELFTD